MELEHITTPKQLDEVRRRMADARRIGFDTEFVSEDCYRPDLCLIQLNVDGMLAIIDPKAVPDLGEFWNTLVEGHHETIVHAGREEFRFALSETGERPRNWFDVQLAAGLVGSNTPPLTIN